LDNSTVPEAVNRSRVQGFEGAQPDFNGFARMERDELGDGLSDECNRSRGYQLARQSAAA
jgi:hypothetical protein